MPINENLQNCELFFEMTQKEVSYLVRLSSVEQFERGVRIVKEGETLESLYIVLEGRCEVVKNMNTKIFQIQKLKQWDHFGEGLFCDQENFSHDVIATEKVSLLKISFDHFIDLFNKHPSAYGLFMHNLLRSEKSKLDVSLGLILRLYSEENASIGMPLLGNRRLNSDEVLAIRRKKHLKKGA